MTYCPTVMVRYNLFVLKVPLNTKQTNKLCVCHTEAAFFWAVQNILVLFGQI